MAATYHQRPSAVVEIRNKVVAYWFDEAVYLFGIIVESRIEQRNKDGTPKYDLEQCLGLRPLVTSPLMMMADGGSAGMDV